MTSVSDLFLRLIGYALVVAIVWEAARGWLRYRDRYRADILWVVGLLMLILLVGDRALVAGARHTVAGFVVTLLFLSQPYFLLRLVSRFTPVPPWLLALTLAVAGGGAALWSVSASTPTIGWSTVVAAYFVGQLAYAAWMFGEEAHESGGVTGARLRYAAIGTWLHVAIAFVIAAEAHSPGAALVGPDIRHVLGLGVFACYYVGLVAPHRLRALWMQRQVFDYVRQTTARAGEARREASAGLVDAVGQGVASVGRAVLLIDDENPDVLVAASSADPDWAQVRVQPGPGLVGRALSTGTPAIGTPQDMEPPLDALTRRLGGSVWAVPIVTAGGRRAGAIVVVQRYGSLFPDDDIEFVRVLAGHLAAALEHGRLVAVEREAERRSLGQRLQQAQKMEAVGQLAGGVAHDFNNLLTAVLGYTTMIQSHPDYNETLNQHLDEIRGTAERATALTARLLAFSRRQVVEPRAVNLPDVVSRLMPMLERVLEDRVRVDFTAYTPIGWILADPVQIEQVVLNLAINARDAMPDGGRIQIHTDTATIAVPTRVGDAVLPPGPYVTLSVTDTGVGIDPETRTHIFEPFFTTKEVGHGTGLGLSTVYGIVKQVGGGIAVDSEQGHGASFRIFLPAIAAPAAAEAAATGTPAPPSSRTILVVDDDAAVRTLVTSWLTAAGFGVLAAASARAALELASNGTPMSLLVTDVVMPGETGPALAEALRRRTPDLRVLYMSGYAHGSLPAGTPLPAGTHFLPKPFSREALVARVRQILAARPV